MKILITTTALACLLVAPAFAQTTQPATGDATTTTAPATGTAPTTDPTAAPAPDTTAAPAADNTMAPAGATLMGDTATVALRFIQFSEADVMASKLDGINIYNNQNEEIGEVEDFVIKDGKTISGVVLSVGGFLDLGDRYVLIDPSSIVLNNRDGTMRGYINTSKEELTNAPEFTYTKS